MESLRTLLDDLADEAKPYDVVDRAVRGARRRRQWQRLAPVAAVLVVGLVATAGWASLRDGQEEAPAGPGPSQVVGWLPASITVPRKAPPPLPTRHGTGPAAAVYHQGNRAMTLSGDTGWYLVTPDGVQYSIDLKYQVLGLSPDGRWLAMSTGNRTLLRDLTGTQVRTVADSATETAFWSRNGRYLALFAGSEVTVLNLTLDSHSTMSLGALPDLRPIAVGDSGVVLLVHQQPAALQIVKSLDPTDPSRPGALYYDAHAVLPPRELLPGWVNVDPYGMDARYLLDGNTLVMQGYSPVTGGYMPHDVFALGYPDAVGWRRYPLPAPVSRDVRKTFGNAEAHAEGGTWLSLLAVTGDGYLLAQNAPDATGWSGPIALQLLDRTTGKLIPATGIHGDIRLIKLRGEP